MAFTYQGSLHGGTNGYAIEKFPISNLAVRKGALLTYAAGASSVSLFTTDTAVPILGIAMHATTTADTKIDVQILPNGAKVEADTSEILNGTELTATGGSPTTFVGSSIVIGQNDVLIGAVVEVVSMASKNKAVGTELTVTDYVSSSGTLQFASLGTTGFATGDKIKIKRLGNNIIGTKLLGIAPTYADNIALDQTSDGSFLHVLGLSDDKKRVVGAITCGWDAADALV